MAQKKPIAPPPHSIEAEQALLGMVFLDSERAITAAMEAGLTPQEFYQLGHQKIFAAMLSLHEKGQPLDLVTLPEALNSSLDKVGGPAYLAELADAVGTSANIGHYAAIVAKKARLRRILEVCQQTIKQAQTPKADPAEIGHGLAGDLSALIEEPTKKIAIEDVVLSDREFLQADIPARRSLLKPWLKESSICLVSGWRGTGKTWFALSLLNAVTRGIAIGPWAASDPVPCLYLDGEMPVADVQERLTMLDAGDRPAPLYIYCDHLAVQQGLSRASLLSEVWRTKITALLKSRGVRLWVIDNLASLAPGLDENKRQDWDIINQWLLELRFAGIATILLHHTGKGGQQRGTSAREDNLDCSILLKAPLGQLPEDGAKFICHFSKARVATKDLSRIADTLFHLRTDEVGRLTWTWGDVKRETKLELLRLFHEGYNQQDAADVLGISKGRVSQLKKQAVTEGLLTTSGQLTQAGFKAVYGVKNAA